MHCMAGLFRRGIPNILGALPPSPFAGLSRLCKPILTLQAWYAGYIPIACNLKTLSYSGCSCAAESVTGRQGAGLFIIFAIELTLTFSGVFGSIGLYRGTPVLVENLAALGKRRAGPAKAGPHLPGTGAVISAQPFVLFFCGSLRLA